MGHSRREHAHAGKAIRLGEAALEVVADLLGPFSLGNVLVDPVRLDRLPLGVFCDVESHRDVPDLPVRAENAVLELVPVARV